MLAHSLCRTPILLSLLAVLALTTGAAISAQPAAGNAGAQAATNAALHSSPVMFIENAGQWPDPARFQVWNGTAGTMWLAEDAIWITAVERLADDVDPPQDDGLERAGVQTADLQPKAVNIKLSFVGANPHPRIEPFDRLDTVVSYFIGNEPDRWRPDVPVWGGVRYVDLYPGVDLDITNEDGYMVQRLTARPGVDLAVVRLRVEGADAVTVDGDTLRLSTAVGDATLPLLLAEVPSSEAAVQPRRVQAFDVASPFMPTRVNPQFAIANPQSPADNLADLLYRTYLGGSSHDWGNAIAVDGAGSAYVTGYTLSSDFPIAPGAFDTSLGGDADAFVVRLNPTGSDLTYATFLGRRAYNESGAAIAVDGAGSAYVTGRTDSDDFPTTPSAFDRSHNGGNRDGSDVFVVKLKYMKNIYPLAANAVKWKPSNIELPADDLDLQQDADQKELLIRLEKWRRRLCRTRGATCYDAIVGIIPEMKICNPTGCIPCDQPGGTTDCHCTKGWMAENVHEIKSAVVMEVEEMPTVGVHEVGHLLGLGDEY